MNVKKSVPVILALCLALVAASCGYQFSETGTPRGLEIRSLAIPIFKSTSSWPGFEGDFTDVIRQEFVSHAKFPIVPKGRADMILLGKIRQIRTTPHSYDLTRSHVGDEETTYEVTNARWLWIRVDVRLVDASSGEVVWHEKSMEEKVTYAVSADPLTNRHNRSMAVREIAEELAQRIYLRTMERF